MTEELPLNWIWTFFELSQHQIPLIIEKQKHTLPRNLGVHTLNGPRLVWNVFGVSALSEKCMAFLNFTSSYMCLVFTCPQVFVKLKFTESLSCYIEALCPPVHHSLLLGSQSKLRWLASKTRPPLLSVTVPLLPHLPSNYLTAPSLQYCCIPLASWHFQDFKFWYLNPANFPQTLWAPARPDLLQFKSISLKQSLMLKHFPWLSKACAKEKFPRSQGSAVEVWSVLKKMGFWSQRESSWLTR